MKDDLTRGSRRLTKERRRGIGALLVLAVLGVACSTPHDVIVDGAIDGHSVEDPSVGTLRDFYASNAKFEQAMQRFDTAPTAGPGPLDVPAERLSEMRQSYDQWSGLVDEVVDLNPKGLGRQSSYSPHESRRPRSRPPCWRWTGR